MAGERLFVCFGLFVCGALFLFCFWVPTLPPKWQRILSKGRLRCWVFFPLITDYSSAWWFVVASLQPFPSAPSNTLECWWLWLGSLLLLSWAAMCCLATDSCLCHTRRNTTLTSLVVCSSYFYLPKKEKNNKCLSVGKFSGACFMYRITDTDARILAVLRYILMR